MKESQTSQFCVSIWKQLSGLLETHPRASECFSKKTQHNPVHSRLSFPQCLLNFGHMSSLARRSGHPSPCLDSRSRFPRPGAVPQPQLNLQISCGVTRPTPCSPPTALPTAAPRDGLLLCKASSPLRGGTVLGLCASPALPGHPQSTAMDALHDDALMTSLRQRHIQVLSVLDSGVSPLLPDEDSHIAPRVVGAREHF